MKTYGGRFLKQKSQQNIRAGRELRDAFVIQVFASEHRCDCKIQGSDQPITAHYNENWESTPQWLKPGNCVRLSTPGGTNHGRIEISGHGFSIPVPIPGGSTTPIDETPSDTIVSGMSVVADGGGMYAYVSTGTYRIADVLYVFGAIEMDKVTVEMDSTAMTMDGTGEEVVFDNLTAGKFRYDLIVIAADGVLDVVKGIETTGEPTKKAVPSNHLLVGWVFFNPSMADSTSAHYNVVWPSDIGASYTELFPSFLNVAGVVEIPWNTETTELTVSVKDQYGTDMSGTYFLTITDLYAQTYSGTISEAFDTPITFVNSLVIDYTKYNVAPPSALAQSSVLSLSESVTGLTYGLTIINLDSGGDPMW